MSFDVQGVAGLQAHLASLRSRAHTAFSSALHDTGEAIRAEAVANTVPIASGALARSGRVTMGETSTVNIGHGGATSSTSLAVTISFGDDQTAPYAVAVHEHPGPHDPPSWRHGQVNFSPAGHGPKYLERPFKRIAPTIGERVDAKLKL